jgi:Ca-activated chloride channel family protein
LARDRRDLDYLGYQNLVLDPSLVMGRRVVKALFVLLALSLAWAGAVRLQGKPTPEEQRMNGIDVMLVLDLSKSMLTQDMVPNRLEAAKKALLNWMQSQEGDRVGLVVFAGEALVQVPLTLDLEAVSLVLSRADVDEVDRGGTDIGKGIQTALDAFPKEDSPRGRAILLITDGELTKGASDFTKACAEAREKKIPIVAVGIGTRQGRPIPDGTSIFGDAVYKKNEAGEVVVSRLDEGTLKKIADSTGGLFVSGDSEVGLASIQSALGTLQKTEMKDKSAVRRKEWAPALGAWSAAALFVSSIL